MQRRKLTKTTLRIYRYMILRGKAVGVRELQRKMKLSSPSLVLYHLNKLEKMGLIVRDLNGKYMANKNNIDLSLLKDIMMIGNISIPKYFFYATFITSLLIAYIFLRPWIIDDTYILGLLIGVSSATMFWYETFKSLK